MPAETLRNARLEARIAPKALAIVRRAAELQGRSVSDFVVSAAHDAAQRAIEDAQLIRLSLDEQARFVELLLKPPAPGSALRRARKAHAKLIVE